MKLYVKKRKIVIQSCFNLSNITFTPKKNQHFENFFVLKQKKIKKGRIFQKNKIIEMKNGGIQISQVARRFGFNLVISGKSYKILCPFHKEKTPSLLLNDEIGTYHCFGCGSSGNAFKLFKYLDANKDRTGYLETKTSVLENSNFKQRIYQSTSFNKGIRFSKLSSSHCLWLLQIAEGFFMENLQINKLLKVLVFSRGISISSSRIYGLGYAPGGRDLLFKYLNKSGLTMKDIIRSGLVYSKKKGSRSYISTEFKKGAVDNFSDVFRGRMIIPIKNRYGVTIGFGGRIINKLKLAKYINSSDSNMFKKKKILFSEHLIVASFQKTFKTLILTEGYMDSIGLFQNGIKFTSASLGTSLGIYQIERLHLLSINCHI